MTDTPSPPGVDDPPATERDLKQHRITWNIRAEIVRRGMTFTQARDAIGMAPSTWDTRMADPMTWRLRELQALAHVLGMTPGALVD
jgi:hypothetical protein